MNKKILMGLIIVLMVPQLVQATTTITDTLINTTGNLTIDTNTLFVDSGLNRVGVGVISPSYMLEIMDTGNALNISDVLFVNGTSGRVGIGTSTPLELLHVEGGDILIRDSAPSFKWNDTTNSQFYEIKIDAKDFLRFIYSPAGAVAMVIDNSGNIGMGTLTPAEKLQVDGDVLFNDTGYPEGFFFDGSSGNIGIGTTSPNYLLETKVTEDAVNLSSILYVNGSSENVGIGTVSPGSDLEISDASGSEVSITFDEGGNDRWTMGIDTSPNNAFTIASNPDLGDTDFIIYADRSVSFDGGAFIFNGSSDRVGIGETSPDQRLHITSSTSAQPVMKIENTNADTNAGRLYFTKTSASQADDDSLGIIDFWGKDSGGTSEEWVQLIAKSSDITHSDEAGKISLNVRMNGGWLTGLTINGYNGVVNQGEIIFNEEGNDVDFRVEGSGEANALFVQGSDGNVGINTSSPSVELEIHDGALCVDDATDSCSSGTAGNIYAENISISEIDVAEFYEVNDNVTAGDVVCMHSNGLMGHCNGSYDTSVTGVVSTNPALILGQKINRYAIEEEYNETISNCTEIEAWNETLNETVTKTVCYPYNITKTRWIDEINESMKVVPIALAGKVPVKVICSTPIEIGNVLVSSGTPGYAQSFKTWEPSATWADMKRVWEHLGAGFGKALESCDSGNATIQVWIN